MSSQSGVYIMPYPVYFLHQGLFIGLTSGLLKRTNSMKSRALGHYSAVGWQAGVFIGCPRETPDLKLV